MLPEAITSGDFEIKKRKLRILVWDIETSPNLSYVWGHYEQNVLHHVEQTQIMCFAAKWLDGKTICKALPDYEGYEPGKMDDKALVTELWNLLDSADVLIHHNGDQFDIRKANSRFVIHGFQPPSSQKMIDTKKASRRYFGFNSNKLNDLGKTLGVGRKVKHTGFDLWLDCIEGDPKAWRLMKKYNRGDVDLLERVYYKLRPWITNHPHIGLMQTLEREDPKACRNCGCTTLKPKGFGYTTTGRSQKFKCADCGAEMRGQHVKMTSIR